MSNLPEARSRPTLAFGLTMAVFAAVLGFDAARGGEGDEDGPKVVLEEQGSPDTLCIFWSTQMHGQVKPCG